MNNPIKVGYVEDQQGIRQMTTTYLQSTGMISVMLEAANGREMLDSIYNAPELPEVCVLDITMPIMDGITLLREIKVKWPQLPCIMFSKHMEKSVVKKSFANGAVAYISKSDPAEELVNAIIETAKSGHYFSNNADKELFNAAAYVEQSPRQLTPLELEFCCHVVKGLSNDQIAVKMNTNLSSIESTARRCFLKMGVTNRVALAMEAIKQGIVFFD